MKKLYIGLLVTMASWLSGNAQCVTNGDFESGVDNTTYSFRMASNAFSIEDCHVDTSSPDFGTIIPTTVNNFGVDGATWIDTGGTITYDPTLLAASVQVEVVNSGEHAIKLNQSSGHHHRTAMSITITPTTNLVSFEFSLIMQEHPGTDPDLDPFFSARIYNPANDQIISLNEICIKADSANDIFTQAVTQLYTDWRCERLIIPESFVGVPVRLEFVIADCGQTAHFGTVYIDDIRCEPICEPDTGFLVLDQVGHPCPTEPFEVCGEFLEPLNSSLDALTLYVIDSNGIATQVTSTPTITGNTFCFDVDPSDTSLFGPTPSGAYELRVDGEFSSASFSYSLFDTSAVDPGDDITFDSAVDLPQTASVIGNTLYWNDVADSYVLEFVSDGGCCPGGNVVDSIYHTTTVNDNFIDLNAISGALGAKCFRWRIKTDCGWSCWCCLASESAVEEYEFEDANYGNVHAPDCYDGPLCDDTLIITNTLANTIQATEERYEHLSINITAYNVVEDDGLGIYKAGEFIELLPNFNAQTGSVFSATIEPCLDACTASEPLPRMNMYNGGESSEYEEVYELAAAFTIYPNPTTGRITVTGEAAAGVFTVIDITGKELLRIDNPAGAKQVDIDLSGLTTGVYFLSADGVTIQKVIKN